MIPMIARHPADDTSLIHSRAAMAAALVTAVLALRVPPSVVSTTRRAIIGGGLAVTSAALPAAAELLFDPIGAYNLGGKSGDGYGQVAANLKGKPNSGILLLRECFDGALPPVGLLEWYEDHLAPDFKASFAGGKVVLDRQAYLAVTADLLKSFPDFVYTRVGPIAYADSPTIVSWKAVVKGTLSGAPFSPLPGVPAVSAKKPPVACENDPEKITAYFAPGSGLTKISKIVVEAVPGGKGFSGPVGFYLQAGGDPSKLPSA